MRNGVSSDAISPFSFVAEVIAIGPRPENDMTSRVEDIVGDPSRPTFAVRLECGREHRLATTWVMAILMTVISSVVLYFCGNRPDSQYNDRLVLAAMLAPLAIFSLLALFLWWSAIRQTLARSVPACILEVDTQPVVQGTPVTLCLKQPGPAHLKSLRVNLLGTQQLRRQDRRIGKTGQLTAPEKSSFNQNVLDAPGGWIRDGCYRQWTCVFELPNSKAVSGKQDSITTTCWFEVWG